MRLGGVVLVMAALFAGCSSDPTPVEPDPAPTTTSATPPRPVPTMPAQASEDSPEGAAAFVKHYVDVFNYAAATGDVAELSRLSSPDCTGCQKYIDEFRRIYEGGDQVTVQLWTLATDALEISGDARVTAKVDVNEGQVKRYIFNFDLPPRPPLSVNNITFKASS